MTLHPKRLYLPGGWLYYLEGGEAENARTPALFLHGWALSSALFQDGLECLAAHRRVIGLDWPGFNRSLWSVSHWRYEDYARVIGTFVTRLGLSHYHLVGHSTGGGIAIACAAQYPDQVRSLTLVDSVGIPLASFWRVLGRKILEIPAQFITTPRIRLHLKLWLTALFNFSFRTVNIWHCMQLPLYVDQSSSLSLLRVPSLVVWGENDGMVPLVLGRQIATSILGAQWMVLPRCYHEWCMLHPQLFAQIVESFISQY